LFAATKRRFSSVKARLANVRAYFDVRAISFRTRTTAEWLEILSLADIPAGLPREVEAIRAAVREVFGPTARILLFGSRARDDLKGGDIDLFVEVEPGQASIANEQRLRDRIAPAVEDLRTDVTLHERGAAFTPLERIALRDGVPL